MEMWKVVDRRVVFSTKRDIEVSLETLLLPNGRVIDDYYQLAGRNAAVVYMETETSEILTVRHYSHGARRICIGLPSGGFESGETPVQAAQRELLEETGYAARDWEYLGHFVRNNNQGGGFDYIFRASGAKRVAEPTSDDLEEMEIRFMNRVELLDALTTGSVAVGAHALAICLCLVSDSNASRPVIPT